MHFFILGLLGKRDGQVCHIEKTEAPASTDTHRGSTSAGVESHKDDLKVQADKDRVEGSVASKADTNKIKCKNEAHFVDRATQTLNFSKREIGCSPEHPCRTFSATANQWDIYDAYQHRHEESIKQSCYPAAVANTVKILEKMVHQNAVADIVQDFACFEDEADRFRGQEGVLLPLWKFQHKKARRFSVTALCWSSKYPQLFAVGLGSVDYISKQEGGLIILYSLKNSFLPEHIFPTTSGVKCLDIHPQHPSLLAVGFYDGCVAIYSMGKKGLKPVCKGTVPEPSSFTNPVFQVCWQNNETDNNHRFVSVDADFRVLSWTQIKHELFCTEMLRLSLTDDPSDEEQLQNLPGGTSLDFHKQIDHVYLVGTVQGKIHKCSECHSDKFLMTYDSHSSEVCTVKWNHFHPRVFISCSFDRTVKVWDDTIKDPVFTFDLRSQVGDVAWAPYSSTVFAAVTVDGIVHVFDLNICKYEAICQQRVVAKEKTKLTCIQFHPVNPVIIVGNSQGGVNSFKLSPNLRKMSKARGPQPEVDKMETCLTYNPDLP
uniref:Dynein, axonemal, intermediate chain 1 n=1 Tax=Nothobranchius furzeri TaxID=105023 RepID=A0A1A7ZE51_NOTFU